MIKKIAAGLLLILGMASLTGCGSFVTTGCNGQVYDSGTSYFNSGSYSYEDSGFNTGDGKVTDEIKKLNIDWISGGVNISYHSSDDISLSEENLSSATTSLDDNLKLRYKVEGDTLQIKFCKSGVIPFNLSKKLNIVLPEGTAFDSVYVNTVSANFTFDTLETAKMTMDGVSGEFQGGSLTVSGDVSFDSVSGDFVISDTLKAANFFSNTTSGDVVINLADISGKVECDAVSGGISFTAARMCNLDFDAVSGDVVIVLPSNPSFKLEFDTVSGDADVNVPALIKDDEYIVGNGDYSFKVDTVSGDITVR